MLDRLRRRALSAAAAVAAPPSRRVPDALLLPATGEADPREEARRLLAMLEAHPDGLGALGRSRELRDVAAELIRRVEDGPKPSIGPTAMRAPEPTAHKLFAAPPPREVAPETPRPAGPLSRGAAARLRARLTEAEAPPAAAAPAAPPVRPAAPAPQALGGKPLAVTIESIRRLALAAAKGGDLAGEHPAIVALALKGRPKREQAMTLRALSGPQARAVHRLLAP